MVTDKRHFKTESFSMIISLLALILSSYSYWSSSIKVQHNLQVSSLENRGIGFNIIAHDKVLNPLPSELSLPVVFLNRGNQSELILDMKIGFIGTDTLIELHELETMDPVGTLFMNRPEQKTDFIIEPGKIEISTLKSTIPLNRRHDYKYHVICVQITFLDENGHSKIMTKRIGWIKIDYFNEGIHHMEFERKVFNLFPTSILGSKNKKSEAGV